MCAILVMVRNPSFTNIIVQFSLNYLMTKINWQLLAISIKLRQRRTHACSTANEVSTFVSNSTLAHLYTRACKLISWSISLIDRSPRTRSGARQTKRRANRFPRFVSGILIIIISSSSERIYQTNLSISGQSYFARDSRNCAIGLCSE